MENEKRCSEHFREVAKRYFRNIPPDQECPVTLRQAIIYGLDEAKRKDLNEYLTALTVEGKIRDLLVKKFPDLTMEMQELLLKFFVGDD